MSQKESIKIQLLIVDKDVAQAKYLESIFDDELYVVNTIHDGLKAYDYLLQNDEFKIVLVDYQLPGMNGLSLIENLKKEGKEYGFIFMTIDDTIHTAVKAMRVGALDFIHKSSDLKGDLPGMVEKVNEIILIKLQRKKYQKELERNEKRYQAVIKNSKIAIWEEDASELKRYIDNLITEGVEDFRRYFDQHPKEVMNCVKLINVLEVNYQTQKIYKGVPKEKFKNLSEFVDKEAFYHFKEEIIAFAEGKTSYEYESVRRRGSSKDLATYIQISVILEDQSDWSRILVTMMDISDLRLTQLRFRNIVNELPQSILYFDTNLKVKYANKSYQEKFNQNSEALIDKSLKELINKHDFLAVTKNVEKVLNGETVRLQQKILQPYSEITNIDAMLIPDVFQHEVVGFYSVLNDVSPYFKVQDELKNNEERYKLLSNSATHLIELSSLKEIYEYISGTLDDLMDNTITVFLTVDEIRQKVRVQSIKGVKSKIVNKINSTFGLSLMGKEFTLLKDHNERFYQDDSLKESQGGLAEFSGPEFPAFIADAIQKMVSIHKIYTIGIKKEDNLYALIHFFTLNNTEISEPKFIESFVKQAGLVIQRKMMEQELTKSENNYRELVQNQGEGIGIVDEKEVFRFVNPAAEEIFGEHSGGLLNKSLTDYLSKEDLRFIKKQTSLRKQNKKSTYEINIKKPSGTTIPILVTVTPKFDQDGSFIGSFGIFRDISLIKHAQKELLIKKQQLQIISDNLPFLVSFVDKDLRYLFANKSYYNFLGKNINIIGRRTKDVLDEKSYQISRPYYKRALEGKKVTFENELKNVNGDLRTVQVNYIPEVIEGQVQGIVILVHDITERKQYEQQLKNKNNQLEELIETKDRLFSIVAHDLKSPFNTILGFLKLMLFKFESYDKKKIESNLNIIFEVAQNTYNLLENLVNWRIILDRSQKFDFSEIRFENILNEVLESMTIIAESKGVEIYADFDEDLIVYAEDNMLKTILRNLISNAVKYSNKNDRIEIHALREDGKVKVSVSDAGVGMTEEVSRSLFVPDKKYVSQTGTDNEKGTGLGLIITKEFIDKHNGSIKVESKENQGSTFTFELPLLREN